MYTIEINRKVLLNKTLDDILELRTNPTLIIFYVSPINQQVRRCTFDEFSELIIIPKRKVTLESVTEIEDTDDSDPDSVYLSEQETINISASSDTTSSTMDSKLKFLNTASSLIKPFNGDSNELDTFIRNITLIQQLTENDLKPFFLDFLKGRISGTVGNACSSVTSVEELIATLRVTVKKESPAVVESKFDALYFDNRNLSEFAAEAEKIGNTYRDALIAEGCSRGFANQITITKTLEVCRKSARNDAIKCILASSNYDCHVDVITKFRTEIALAKKERLQNVSPYQGSKGQYNNNSNRSNGFNFNNNTNHNFNGRWRAPPPDQNRSFNNNNNRSDNTNRPWNNNSNNNNNARVHVLNNEQGNEDPTRWSYSEMETENQ